MAKAAARPKRTLRTLLIEPFKQLKLGIYVLTLSLAFVAITGILVINAFTEQYQHVMEIFQVVDPHFKWEVVTNDVFYTNVIRIGSVLITYIVVMFAVVFRATHKYYGPLVSVERFVKDVKEGDYSRRLVVRKGDELQDLAVLLNQMAETLEKRHGNRRSEDRRKSSKTDHIAG